MPNTYQIGRLGRLYVALEPSAYGTAAVLAATDAVRHLNLKLDQNPRNRVNSPERHAHPSQLYRFTRRKTAEWMVSGIFYPSGTLNTLPDHDPILQTVFGARTNVTLSTTVSAAPAPTTTVFTVASAAGLAVGDAVLVNATSGGRQVRFITAIAGAALTVDPALSAAPASGDSVKGCITYKLATALLANGSLNLAHYLTSMSWEIKGGAPESFKITFESNDEIMWEASGPAKNRVRPAQTDPTTFTTVGTTPPSGLTGYLRIGAAAEEFLKASFELKNGIELDNIAFGTADSQAMYRAKKREVECEFDTMVSDDITILDLAENTTDTVGLVQCGLTEGSIVAAYSPKIELETPDDPNDDETMQHSYKGICKGTTGNDEFYLAVA